ncbi:tectonic [Anastrepha ludens]|uniref:tectonic n=1 Tax=Anastrepha ludens TaxID=28586 RepID=UPI0023B1C7E6|nr:tectonic [Anastrepha ludens]
MKKTLWAALILLLLQIVAAVKIGVSRVNLETTSSTSTTTSTHGPSETFTESAITTAVATATTSEDSTLISDRTEIDIESSTTATTTTTKAKPTTIKPNFTIAIFPPRLKPTKAPKITTTTTTTSTTPPTTVSTAIPNATLNTNAPEGSHLPETASNDNSYYCECDLLLDACDLNCCCDRDCTPEALQVFNCNAAPKHPQLKNRLKDFQYEHGLPSCKVNDGWLCVFRTNTRQERQKAPVIDLNTNHYYKWPTPVWDFAYEQDSNDENVDHYKYGEPLQFLNMKTMLLKQFDLPHTFKPPHCQIKEPVKFLKSYKTNCLLDTIEELKLNARNLLTFIQTNKLLLKPLKQANELDNLAHILSDFTVKICQKQQCEIVPLTNSTALELHLHQHFYATEIKFKLLHNYTQLYGGLLELSDKRESHNNTELWQKYQVEYIYKNITVNDVNKELNKTSANYENAPKLSSGPLGYLQGKPIIIARFIANNQSEVLSPTNQVLDYFHINSTKSQTNHTFSLFTTRQQLCARDTNSANLINYGISTWKQCKLRFSNESLAKLPQSERNFTKICIQLQTEIVALFFSANIFQFGQKFPDLYISQLGRPENRSDKWTLLQLRNHDFAPISGEFNAHAQSFSCRNMLLNIAYEFLVGHFTEAGIRQQALVKQATLVFGERNDLEFEMDEAIEMPLLVSVMFFDYSKDASNTGLLRNDADVKWHIILLSLVGLYRYIPVL